MHLYYKSFLICSLLLLFFCADNISHSQTTSSDFEKQRKSKEAEKSALQKDIELTNKILGETNESKTISLNQLEILNQQIRMREKLIMIMNEEIKILTEQLDEVNSIVQSLEKDMKKLKEEYARMIYFAYKNTDSFNRLMFLFASESFNQAYKRMKYLQQYSNYRQDQAKTIVKTKGMLSNKIIDLEKKKKEKNDLLIAEELEKKELKVEKLNKAVLVENLQLKEKQLKKDLKEKQKASERLTKAIEDIIKKEIEARKKADIILTPEAIKLSVDFESNKGVLPWPVEKGIVTSTFGTHEHPVLKGIMISNNGLDVKTNKGEKIRAVFDGVVSGVVAIPGAQIAVIIRHGEYLTVYSNLSEVFIKRGDHIETKQQIGIAHTDEKDGKTELHYEMWKNTTKLNPSDWLYKK